MARRPKPPKGFARSKGVALNDLQVREMDGGRYVTAVVRQAGRATPDVLAEALPGLVAGLRFDKSMRWNSSNVSFSRPIRWLLAMYGAGDACQVVPFEYAGLTCRGYHPRSALPAAPGAAHPLAAGVFRVPYEPGHPAGWRRAPQTAIQEQVDRLAPEVGGADPGRSGSAGRGGQPGRSAHRPAWLVRRAAI